jgi:Trypsin-co-occurring domain 1
MDYPSRAISAKLADGTTIIRIEASVLGEQEVASTEFSFTDATSTIEAISKDLMSVLKRVEPKKATVKFGVELAIESGKLTAMLVKGSAKANVEITLEWTSMGDAKQ